MVAKGRYGVVVDIGGEVRLLLLVLGDDGGEVFSGDGRGIEGSDERDGENG